METNNIYDSFSVLSNNVLDKHKYLFFAQNFVDLLLNINNTMSYL
jgi:hypothetical protein